MRILVCVKQVPRLDQVRFQPGINRIVREGVDVTTNPLDIAALEHAWALRTACGAEVVAVTMGPPAGSNPVRVIAVGRAQDQLVRVDGKWLIKVRNVAPQE